MQKRYNPVPRYGLGVGRASYAWGNPSSSPPLRYGKLARLLKLQPKTKRKVARVTNP